MSANQIPGPRLYDREWDGKSLPHSCPRCWRNGGSGHRLDHLIEEQELRRARVALEPPAITDPGVLEYLTAPTVKRSPIVQRPK